MSIASELNRIKAAKSAIKSAINAKGGTLTDEQIDQYANAIASLPSGSSIDLTGVNVTADGLLEGVVAVNGAGQKVTGNIKTVLATLSANVVTVPKGYVAEAQTLTVSEMAEPSVSANVVTIPVGYNKAEKGVTISEAEIIYGTSEGGNVTKHSLSISPGYIPEEKSWTFHETDLNGINATADKMLSGTVSLDASGEKITGNIPTVTASLENDVVTVPKGYIAEQQTFEVGSSGGSMEFYKCRAVHAVSKTWDGYKVTFDSRGIADISAELTTGLTYGAVAPVRQNIYSADGVHQVRGAMLSGTLPTPFFYISGETPSGGIWVQASNTPPLRQADGDEKGFSGSPNGYSNYVDGNYLPLPGFPESASSLDWAFSMWYRFTSEGIVIGAGAFASARPNNVLRINPRFKWVDYNGSWGAKSGETPFTTFIDWQEGGWNHLVISYNSAGRKYTIYLNAQKYAEFVEETATDRLFDRFEYSYQEGASHLYFFSEQLTEEQVKILYTQRWKFEGLVLSGLDEVYSSEWGANVSPNGKLVENGTYMNKPKYYVSDEMGMSSCNIQWNGTQWEIFVNDYDEDWNTIKKVLATGEGGNDPSEAEWTNVGYGLPTVVAKYANGI